MDIKELEQFMIEKGIVIRAIPLKKVMVIEARHIKEYPNGVVYHDKRFKRDMLRVEEEVSSKIAGKFMIEKADTGTMIPFYNKNYYNTIEEAINDYKEKDGI